MGCLVFKSTKRLFGTTKTRPERIPRVPTMSEPTGSSFSTKRPPQVYRYGCPPAPPSTPVSTVSPPPRTPSTGDFERVMEREPNPSYPSIVEVILNADKVMIPVMTPAQWFKPTRVANSFLANKGAVPPSTPGQAPFSVKAAFTTPVRASTNTVQPHTSALGPVVNSTPSPMPLLVPNTINVEMRSSTSSPSIHQVLEDITAGLPPMRHVESYLSLISSVSTFDDERQLRWTCTAVSRR